MTRISPIYHHGPSDPPAGAEAKRRNHEAYRRAWQQLGLVVIDLETVLDDWIRQAIQNETERQYGKRGK